MASFEEYDRRHVVLADAESTVDTDEAILLGGDYEGDEIWIPKSQIHDDSEVYAAEQTGKLIITMWIAKKKGLWEG